MTDTAPPGAPAADTTTAVPDDPDRQLQDFVQRRVNDLARRSTAGTPGAAAHLARLRRAVEHEPGSDPMIWPDTMADFPATLIGTTDRPSRYERAAHSAITLFAEHQHSRNTPMHRDGTGVGVAVRRISGRPGFSEEATLCRFHAAATASSYPVTVRHLAALVTQLAAAGVALDYGLLARDLARLQTPAAAYPVFLTWARDYHRRPGRTTPRQQTPVTPASRPPDPRTGATACPAP